MCSEKLKVGENNMFNWTCYIYIVLFSSVLMTARDQANNSRTARRFVIYDPVSNISLMTKDGGKMYVSSADETNGYSWQTTFSGKLWLRS